MGYCDVCTSSTALGRALLLLRPRHPPRALAHCWLAACWLAACCVAACWLAARCSLRALRPTLPLVLAPLLVVAGVPFGGLAHGQDGAAPGANAAGEGEPGTPATTPEDGAEDAPVAPLNPDALQAPAVELSSLDTRWRIMRRAEPGSADEAAAMQSLQRTAIELGLTELPAHSLVLLQEADAANQSGDVGRAETLKTWAEELSPLSAQPAFFDARVSWETRPYDVARIVGHLGRAYRSMHGSLAGATAIGMIWRRAAVEAIAGFSLLLIVLLLIRYAAPIALDVRVRTGRAITLAQGHTLIVLVALTTSLVWNSPFALVCVGVALAAFHAGWLERALLALVVAGLVGIPMLAHDYALLVSANESSNSRVVAAIVAPCDARCVGQLDRLEQQGNANATLALAWVSYRRGTRSAHADALARLDVVDASEAVQVSALRSSAAALRGNIAFSQGDSLSAETHYRTAHEHAATATQRAAALLGVYRAQLSLGQRDVASDTLNLALRADDRLVQRHLEATSRTQNAVLAVSPLPASVLTTRALSEGDSRLADDATEELLSAWYGAVAVRYTVPIAGGLAFLLLLGALAKRQHWVARRCTRCGSPTHRWILADAYDRALCALCYPLIAAAGRLTYAQRRAREYRIQRWGTKTRIGAWVADVLVPGAGHFCEGRTALGLLPLLLGTATVLLALLDTTPLSIPYALGSDRLFTGQLPLAILTAMVAWGIALLARIFAGDK